MKAKAVDFVSFSVTDMDKSEAFYRDVLGLDVEVQRGERGTRASGYMELDAGGVAIGLVAMPQTHPNAVVAFAVDSVTDAVEELRGKGVPIAEGWDVRLAGA
ncbi:MAG TPA: VOC family protein [Gemmatimonadota bacterium]|nr:VOC family protein [Gemmatimonadota bacterium]